MGTAVMGIRTAGADVGEESLKAARPREAAAFAAAVITAMVIVRMAVGVVVKVDLAVEPALSAMEEVEEVEEVATAVRTGDVSARGTLDLVDLAPRDLAAVAGVVAGAGGTDAMSVYRSAIFCRKGAPRPRYTDGTASFLVSLAL
jgi:hypothetical protein